MGARPEGVSALSLIEVIGGAGTVVIGAWFLNAVNSIAASVGLGAANIPDFYLFFAAEIVVGALAVFAGLGLWTRKRWARALAVYLGIAVVTYALGMGAYFLATYGDFTETEAMLLPMAVSLGAVYYLEKPVAKAFFGA
jgi:hypothetical protein